MPRRGVHGLTTSSMSIAFVATSERRRILMKTVEIEIMLSEFLRI